MRILPSFETVVDEQATKMDFVTALKPRAAIVEKLDVTNSRAFFLDALGVEYLGFIQEKCSEYGLSADVSCGRCELPSITSQNKEFVATLQSKGYAGDLQNFRVIEEIAVGKVFFNWIFGFEGKVRIKGPESVKKQYREMVMSAMNLV